MPSPRPLLPALLLAASTLLGGCGAVLVGGAATGAGIIHDRRTSGIIVDDQAIKLKIMDFISKHEDIASHSDISVTSYNLSVLLAGTAENESIRRRVADYAANLPRVQRVYNEITIGPRLPLKRDAADAYLTAKIKAKLFGIELEAFDPTRVKVVTVNGVVYLMGLLTDKEAEAVVDLVRHIDGVERVVKLFDIFS